MGTIPSSGPRWADGVDERNATGMTNPQPVLSVQEAALAFGERVLWRDLDLDLFPGEFLAVLGPNGAGKSTLLKAVLGPAAAARPAGSRRRPAARQGQQGSGLRAAAEVDGRRDTAARPGPGGSGPGRAPVGTGPTEPTRHRRRIDEALEAVGARRLRRRADRAALRR